MSTAPEQIFGQAFAEMIRMIVREELNARSMAQETELLTADQVAKMLSLTRHAVYDLKREGKLKPVMTGERAYRFSREEVERFIRERTA